MPTPFRTEDERGLRYQIEWAQNTLGESFALVAKRLREKADDIERQAMRAAECALQGDLGAAHINVADAILNEIAWLTPNLPTAIINSKARDLTRYEAILRQMGVLVTDEERAAEADRATNQALVDKVKGMIERGVTVKVGGVKVTDLSLGYQGEIMYRLKGRKFSRTATADDIEELRAADNPSYVSRRSIA